MNSNLTISNTGTTATYFYQNRADSIRENAKSATSSIHSLVKVMQGFGLKITNKEIIQLISKESGMEEIVLDAFENWISTQGFMPPEKKEREQWEWNKLINFNAESRRQLFRHIQSCPGLRFIYNEERTYIVPLELEAYILDTCAVPVSEARLALINFTATTANYMGRGFYPQDFVCKDEAGNLSPEIERILAHKIN